jgi:hypothetical protein
VYPIILLVVMGAVVGAIIWKVADRGRGDAKFTIEVTGPGIDGVKMKGAVPGRSAGEILDFVARLELPPGSSIWGVHDRGRMRLEFAGNVPDNLRQRMRNFFYN